VGKIGKLNQITFFPCSLAVLNKYRLASVKPVRALLMFASVGRNSSKNDSNFPSPIKKFAKYSKNYKTNTQSHVMKTRKLNFVDTLAMK
jgi:hypothetical protein